MAAYRTMAEYLTSVLGGRIQKIAVNAGLGCPNRDGTLSRQGCLYCNNAAFNPAYAFESVTPSTEKAVPASGISRQLEAGIRFFSRKGRADGYLAYFQSYSNTYGQTEHLIRLYEEALSHPGIAGLVIATRPDCLAEDLLDYLETRFGRKAPSSHPFLLMETGVESTNDDTLLRIGRGHTFECASIAIRELDRRGIPVGAHLILGLPGETEADYIMHARRISALPITTLKLHQLQIIKGTPLADAYLKHPDSFALFSPEEYADIVVRFLHELRTDIAMDRFVSESPASMVIAPRWGIKPALFQAMVEDRCRQHLQPDNRISPV